MRLLLLLLLSRIPASLAQPPCNAGVDFSGHDLEPSFPVPAGQDAQWCAQRCAATGACRGFVYAAPGCRACASPGGCCTLKAVAASANASAGGCTCGFIMRADPASLPPTPTPAPAPAAARSVLYILVDDLRPELAPYGEAWMVTPALRALALSGTTFDRAYCQIAVCSPSRMSFLTGRVPAHSRDWNFINHFRQASCVETPGTAFIGPPPYRSIAIASSAGGAGECCTQCTSDGPARCVAWGLDVAAGMCHLHNVTGARAPSAAHIVGGPGTLESRSWVSLPEHFTRAGFFTQSAGKVFHTEEGGLTPPWDGPGTGMPPLQDPPSWSRGSGGGGGEDPSMANVNAVAPMRGCGPAAEGGCSVNASASGDVPFGTPSFCDRVIGDDAVRKLRLAVAQQRGGGGQPWMLAVGFRKPHLPFRHPAPWDALYPAPADIPLAAFPTMDASVPPIAFHQTALAANPYVPMAPLAAGTLRRDYYAAISWTDSQIGRVLDELDALGVANETLVVFHADHGWSLGEGGEWEKFTCTEFGTRIPFIIRAPWLPGSAGTRSSALAELVDVFPTMAELAGVPAPSSYKLDGVSLVPQLQRRAEGAPPPPPPRAAALSVYPRCPGELTNATLFWKNNDCLLVERSAIPFMGVSIRTDAFRYTEWLPWDGAALRPKFDAEAVGVELYNHSGDDGSFDGAFEHINLAGTPAVAALQAALAVQLRATYVY